MVCQKELCVPLAVLRSSGRDIEPRPTENQENRPEEGSLASAAQHRGQRDRDIDLASQAEADMDI